jgi:membrane protease YdiL (CAAX protease family)
MEWNQNIVFPDSLKIIENWLIHKENQLKVLTEFMTTYDNIWSLLTGVIVIAIIPAIGEELVFRGIFQNIFKSFFKNYHVSIWLTAFIFSAIHLQFYGFFPRMLLGAVFGYVFYWTGNILIPIFMHFCNNAGTLIILHFNHQKIITLDTESTEDIPLTILFTTLIISLCTTYLIYKSKNQI